MSNVIQHSSSGKNNSNLVLKRNSSTQNGTSQSGESFASAPKSRPRKKIVKKSNFTKRNRQKHLARYGNYD